MEHSSLSFIATTVKFSVKRKGIIFLFWLVALCMGWPVAAQSVYEDYTFTTLAGAVEGGPGWTDGLTNEARFGTPAGVAKDSLGNIYVADPLNHTIRKLAVDGVISTVAGETGVSGTADGTGFAARFKSPYGIAVDSVGNLFVADTGNHTVRKISPLGVVTTFAGAAGVSGSTDGDGPVARFNTPYGVMIDGSDNIYVADTGNDTIRKITPAGQVTTFAGKAGVSGAVDKTGTAATFTHPRSLAMDSQGNIYVADTDNELIRKISPDAAVTTLAGKAHNSGSSDGTNDTARFNTPYGVTVDSEDNIFVADTVNDTIREITPLGVVTTPEGSAGGAGSVDGVGGVARFSSPTGILAINGTDLIVADFSNSSIRKILAGAVVTTVAGVAGGPGSKDGSAQKALFNFPAGVAVDTGGNVYVADEQSDAIRKITPLGDVSTFAGALGVAGTNDDVGTAAKFSRPLGVAFDPAGNLVVADAGNNTIRRITAGGMVSTLAGSPGVSGTNDGVGSNAQFNSPFSVAVDAQTNIYVADTFNHAIRKITPGGLVTTLAGTIGTQGTNNGTGVAAQFAFPEGIAVDPDGNIFVADDADSTVRKITPDGVVTTFVGGVNKTGFTDGVGTDARFNFPFGLAIDANRNLYVADTANQIIRKVTPGGSVTTLGGLAGIFGNVDGNGNDARLHSPQGIGVGSDGALYVSDKDNQVIRKATPALPDVPTVDLLAARVGVARHFSISNLTTTSWSWKLIRRPAASSAQLLGANTANPTFTPDVEDVYVVRFQGSDNSGRTTIKTLTLYADDTAPSLTITNPVAGQISSNDVFTVRGTASDNLGLSNVWVQINGGAWTNAIGTVNWSAQLALAPGTNVIRAYAKDLAGNVSLTNEVDFFHVASATVTVKVNGGGSVTPNLNGVLLAIGNTYSMTAQAGPGSTFVNWTGDVTNDSATLTFVMQSNLTFIANFTDPIRPTLAITFPKNKQGVSNAVFNATGTASDNGQLAGVWYQLNGGEWIQTTNTSNWIAKLSPVPGANTLQVYAEDTFTNFSTTNSVNFTYIPSGQMTVTMTGRGTLVPNYNGALLAVGKSFKMTAKPDLGYIFYNWVDGSGNALTKATALSFLVQSNTALRANFILNPFAHFIGPFAGLFYETNNVTVTNSGFVSLTLTGLGNFSAKLSLAAGTTIPISGQFSPDGVFSNSIVVKGSTPYVVQLQMDGAHNRIIGSVSDSGWTAPLVAIQAFYSSLNSTPVGNKKYTLVIPGGDDSLQQPGGNGYGTVSVNGPGDVAFSGVLGDGVKVAQKTFISKQNQWPFFAAPYKGQGVVLGWLSFTTNDSNSDLGGLINWIRQPGGKIYPDGFNFTNGIQAIGSLYSFTNGVPLLNLPAGGAVVLQEGNLPQSFTNHFNLSAANKATSTDGLKLTITTKTGLFKGTASDPNGGGSVPINGVLLQKQNAGFGTFLDASQSGAVYLGQ
jgi:hypothetical protein